MVVVVAEVVVHVAVVFTDDNIVATKMKTVDFEDIRFACCMC